MQPSKVLLATLLFFTLAPWATASKVTYDGRAIIIDGKHKLLVSGSIHYPRSTAQMWPDLIKKSKEGGLDAVETYVFWDSHEPARREYDFSGNLDLIRFLKTIQDEGLYAVLRIGPYVCAEWNYGGFPVWLHNMPGVQLRTANDVFMNEMRNFTTLIVNMVKQENLFASQGGPVILAQIENEYGNVMSSYGDEGKAYIEWCANVAQSLHIGVPWLMCQQADAPEPMINTCNGWYCDQFTPNRPTSPKMWTENWTGWFKSWGGKDPHRTAEDLAFAVARFYQLGGTFQNYYMYHGGTNFGRTAGGPYITTSYDYDAPLDEYGNLNQPKWGHLKELHDVLHSMEDTLTRGNISSVDFGNSVSGTIYSTEKGSSCFLTNTDSRNDTTINFQGIDYEVPAWSVSILPDCQDVVYNTAKVSAQTSVMVKKKNVAEDEPAALSWSWRPETNDKSILFGKGEVSVNQILDQKDAGNDQSDYLFYMTSVSLKEDDPIWGDNMTLRITGSGQVLHVFVNGEFIGSQWAKYGVFDYVFEQKIKLNKGKNTITLLSATVGFANYGANFDLTQAGVRGPVELVGYHDDEIIIKDLSSHKWSYKVGLEGLHQNLYSSDSSKWQQDNYPTNKMFTWYKATFKAPLGTDPVVVDLLGLGKGLAWVNGNSIGRYWPSFIAEDGCGLDPCDYRGSYDNNKCVTNCGKPTQRWYHVPRSFLNNEGDNTLVLFEEFGGDPSSVNFQTIAIGSACVGAEENKKIELSCQGRPISAIKFASFGNPLGTCGSFSKGTCEASNDAFSIIQKACVGQESCTIDVSEDTFGSTTCGDDVIKTLAVEAIC
ncbi:PREDICTED: beta-galactosidase 15-like [Populus euphratica]|uniref:Beta-galactosidase n=1 Tax=Populus euphratica TaxID=75702 RepID=A0AAJ6X078_POPEU|nr:PREDICTED: beta-galactosidase 15-like [Populus euphratica]